MMKVGILSMQHVINYGSYLQAYALKKLLIACGAKEVCFLDIEPGKPLPGYRKKSIKNRFRKIIRGIQIILKGEIQQRINSLNYNKKIAKAIKSEWPLLGENKFEQTYDLVVIGSDEVFNCCQSTIWGFTKQLYGDVSNAKNVISYAGSFGRTTFEEICEKLVADDIRHSMMKMKSISVRDLNSYNIVEKLVGIKPYIHLDPVLIYGYKEELRSAIKPNIDDYILIYSYPDRISDQKEIQAIKSFAAKKKKKLVCIMCSYSWCDYAVVANPFEVLSYFKYADSVISETFHGTIFSIIAHKQFISIVRESSVAKLKFMLSQLGLQGRVFQNNANIFELMESKIDYSAVEVSLEKERSKSLSYLRNEISKL